MTLPPETPTKLEALLRDACRRATDARISFTNAIRLYRSILALTREVRRLPTGFAAPPSAPSLSELLATACDNACEIGADPDLPLPDAILVQRLALALSRAAHLAGPPEPASAFSARTPMRREKPPATEAGPPEPASAFSARTPMRREKPVAAVPDALRAILAKTGSQDGPAPLPDEPEDENPLSAWRNDHTNDRDQRAHERLRTVLEARLFEPAWAEGRRIRAEREAAAATLLAWPASASAPPSGAEFPPPDAGFDRAFARPLGRRVAG
jgi:hypothetical protein